MERLTHVRQWGTIQLLIVGGTLLVALFWSFGAPAEATVASRTAVVVPCPGYAPMERPFSMVIACGDGSVVATNLSWSSWGGSSAKASGKVAANNFKLDGAQGKFNYFAAHFALSDLRSVDGDMRYLKVTVTYSRKRPYGGEAPWGRRSNTYFLSERSGIPFPIGTFH